MGQTYFSKTSLYRTSDSFIRTVLITSTQRDFLGNIQTLLGMLLSYVATLQGKIYVLATRLEFH